MHETIRAHFAELEEAVQTTTISTDRKQVIAASIKQLTALYAQYRETNESRYGDELTQRVQSVLTELRACPEAAKLDATFRAKLHFLHESLGLPILPLKAAPKPPAPKKKKQKPATPKGR